MSISINKIIKTANPAKILKKSANAAAKYSNTNTSALRDAAFASVQADLMRMGMCPHKARAIVLVNLYTKLK